MSTVRRGFVTLEAVAVLVLAVGVVISSVALLSQVVAAAGRVKLPGLEAFEVEVWRLASATPPGGVEVGPSGVTFRWLTAYRGGEAKEAVLSLSGSEVVLSDGSLSRVVARGVREASFAVSGGVLRVGLRGDGWSWERDFVLLGGG